MLTDEQYTILLKEEHSFDTLVNHGYSKNLQHPFLGQMKEIFHSVFNEPPVNLNCPKCVSNAMVKLWPLMEEKKQEYVKRKEDAIIAETIRLRDEKVSKVKK